MLKKETDIMVGGFLAILSVAYYTATYSITKVDMGTLDSGAVPRIYAIILFLLSIMLIIEGVGKAKRKIETVALSEGEMATEKEKLKAIIVAIVVLGVSIILMGILGFIVSMALYMLVSFTLNSPKEKRNYVLFLGLSVGISIAIYLIFTRAFQLMLPLGIFK